MPLPASLCLYCGSSTTAPAEHMALAEALGRLTAAAGVTLVYGGGRVGLMGAAASAALAAGGHVVGIIPRFLIRREVGHGELTELVTVETMHERKQIMAERADAFCVLPGGLGTLDETFEIVTWAQLGLHAKPVVLVNHRGFWDPLFALLDRLVEARYVGPAHRRLFHAVAGVEEVLPTLRTLGPTPPDDQLERI